MGIIFVGNDTHLFSFILIFEKQLWYTFASYFISDVIDKFKFIYQPQRKLKPNMHYLASQGSRALQKKQIEMMPRIILNIYEYIYILLKMGKQP